MKIMKTPQYIPCVTSSKNPTKFDIHLISPRKNKPLHKAINKTIIDCFTFGLIRNRHINPYKHYEWYIDLVEELQEDSTLVFVAPDWEWLNDTAYLNELWEQKIYTANCLVVPDTYLFDKVKNVVGYALKNYQNTAHPEWTHSFSKSYRELDGPTELWTYDSGTEI